jgi:hypothetical protein
MTILLDTVHDLECASAAYAVLIERAVRCGDRKKARSLRREFKQYQATSVVSPAICESNQGLTGLADSSGIRESK